MDKKPIYFIRAKRHPWVKIGRSKDIITLDKRVKAIISREPFESFLWGVSTSATESEAHEALRRFRLRAEWFRWGREVRSFALSHCGVYCCERDCQVEWWDLVDGLAAERNREEAQAISRSLETVLNNVASKRRISERTINAVRLGRN